MRYVIDNSASNERNPSTPPERVVHGWKTKDKMAELWLQVLPRNPNELAAPKQSYTEEVAEDRLGELIAYGKGVLALMPDDPATSLKVAEGYDKLASLFTRQERWQKAEDSYLAALELPRPSKTLPKGHRLLSKSIET